MYRDERGVTHEFGGGVGGVSLGSGRVTEVQCICGKMAEGVIE